MIRWDTAPLARRLIASLVVGTIAAVLSGILCWAVPRHGVEQYTARWWIENRDGVWVIDEYQQVGITKWDATLAVASGLDQELECDRVLGKLRDGTWCSGEVLLREGRPSAAVSDQILSANGQAARGDVVIVVTCGWPARSLGSGWHVRFDPVTADATVTGVVGATVEVLPPVRGGGYPGLGDLPMPLRPLLVGVLVNSGVYGGAYFIVATTVDLIVRAKRSRSGRCPRCGYPAAARGTCSECGWRLKRRPPAP